MKKWEAKSKFCWNGACWAGNPEDIFEKTFGILSLVGLTALYYGLVFPVTVGSGGYVMLGIDLPLFVLSLYNMLATMYRGNWKLAPSLKPLI